jgi:steroid Delta-isomerase
VPTDAALKELALEHCRRVNARDVDGLLKIYAENVRFEDPVGTGLRVGREAMRAHAMTAIGASVHEEPGRPVAAQDGRHAAVPVTGTMPLVPGSPVVTAFGLPVPADASGKLIRVDYVMVIRADPHGLIDEMRSYWGRTDIRVVDREPGVETAGPHH